MRRSRSRWLGLLASGVLATIVAALLGAVTALAAPAAIALDSDQATLSSASDGGSSASVGLTNLTDAPASISATPETATCDLTVGDGTSLTLAPARHTDVTVGIPRGCAAKDGFRFTIRGATQALDVTASADTTPAARWSVLLSFLVAPGVALVVVALVYLYWRRRNATPAGGGLLAPLAGLDASWSFKDSWATNTTAASGLVVAVLGSSDVLTKILGPKAESAIAVTTVAGAVALALVGAAGVLVLTLKRPEDKETSVVGLLAGTVVALGAAGGQIWAVTLVLHDVDLGVAATVVDGAAVAASLLLALYAWTSVNGLLTQGTAPDPPKDPLASPVPPEVVAAAIVAASEHGEVTRAAVTKLLAELGPQPAPGLPIVVAMAAPAARPLHARSALP